MVVSIKTYKYDSENKSTLNNQQFYQQKHTSATLIRINGINKGSIYKNRQVRF